MRKLEGIEPDEGQWRGGTGRVGVGAKARFCSPRLGLLEFLRGGAYKEGKL